jgi:hypothetical protein
MAELTKEQVVEALVNEGITSLEQIAEIAVETAKKEGDLKRPNPVKINEGTILLGGVPSGR